MRNLLACSPQLSLVLATNLISQFHSTNRAHGITLKYKNMTTCRESECLDTELNVNYTVLRHLTHHYKKLYNSCKFHGPIYTTTEVTAFQKLEKTKKHEFASLKTAKVPLFKHPYHAKYLEYWAKILHTAYIHVYRHLAKFSCNLEMVTRKSFGNLTHFKWNDPEVILLSSMFNRVKIIQKPEDSRTLTWTPLPPTIYLNQGVTLTSKL